MEVKRICQWCGKPFMAKKTTTNYCSPQCSKRGYKHRMKERRMEMREFQEMQEVKSKLESQEYFIFSQAARLMGVSRQYVYKLVKEDKLRASRLSSRMSLIRRADIELMLKTKPYEVLNRNTRCLFIKMASNNGRDLLENLANKMSSYGQTLS